MLLLSLSLLVVVPEPEARPVEEINGPRDLWMASRWYGLPIAPPEHRLICQNNFHGAPGDTLLGWVLPPTDSNSATRIEFHSGYVVYEHRPSILKDDPIPLASFELAARSLPQSEWRTIAIRCWQQGQHDLARFAFEKWSTDAKPSLSWPPEKSLCFEAFRYWERQLFEPDADRRKALLHLERIDRELSDARVRTVVEQLRLTMQPSRAQPGSNDAAVDALCDANCNSDYYSLAAPKGTWTFDSIPVLMRQFQDRRLTRHRIYNRGCFSSFQDVTVGEACQEIVWNLLGRPHSHPSETAAKLTLDEWAIARQRIRDIGEAEWCVSRILSESQLNPALLAILQHHHPKELVPLYERELKVDDAESTSGELLEAICASALPAAVRRRCLVLALETERFSVRVLAARRFARAFPDDAPTELLKLLKRLERDANTSSGSQQLLYYLTGLVAEVNHEGLWREFAAATKPLPVAWKLNLLAENNDLWQERVPGTRRGPLLLLRGLLDDATTFERPGRPSFRLSDVFALGPRRVQDLAALHLAWVFDEPGPRDANWTDREWSEFRRRITQLTDARLESLARRAP